MQFLPTCALVLIPFVSSCSKGVATARAQADAQAQPSSSPSHTDTLPTQEPPYKVSALTGIKIRPSFALGVLAPADVGILDHMETVLVSSKCKERESYSITSADPFRSPNMFFESLATDAKVIGWKFQPIKHFDNADVYRINWHAETRFVFIYYQPTSLLVRFCTEDIPAASAQPAQHK